MTVQTGRVGRLKSLEKKNTKKRNPLLEGQAFFFFRTLNAWCFCFYVTILCPVSENMVH